MDTIFIWLIAGAAIGLLGIFLVASERELKSKRHELEKLKNKLADGPAPAISNSPTDFLSQDNGETAGLIARNEELLQEVSSLSKKLEASESRSEQLETLRAHLNSKESEITELRWDRERLQTELATLKTQSESNNPHPDEATPNSPRDAEVAALKEQLEASQAKIRHFESTPAQLDDAEARQKAFEELQRSLEVSTLQLQNALAAEQEKQKALEAIQMQLSEMQQRYHEMSEANIRLRQENSQHQQKITNQNQLQVERLVILRQRLEALRSKQAEVSEQEHIIQEEIISMSQLLDVAPESTLQPEPSDGIHEDQHHDMLEFKEEDYKDDPVYTDIVERTPLGAPAGEQHTLHNDGFDESNGISTRQNHHSTPLPPAVNGGTSVTNELSPSGLTKKKRRFGIFPAAMGVLVVGGVLAANILSKDSEQKASDTPKPLSASTATKMKSQSAATVAEQKEPRASDKAVKTSHVESRTGGTSEQPTTIAVAPSGKASPTVWESYEVVQATRVFSAPSEHSQLVANVEPGTQVNVVDSRNGWLEIRSKHGRPPGFIQKTAAIRIGQN
jgi:hypothetical protein